MQKTLALWEECDYYSVLEPFGSSSFVVPPDSPSGAEVFSAFPVAS
jgi:hypothetical protein